VELLMATGQFDEALKRIDQCLEYDPLSPNHHFSKGNIYYLSGDLQTALSFYIQALNTNPNFQLTLNKVGFLHILLGNEEELKNILPKLEEPEAANHLFELVHGHNVPLNETLANGLIDKFTLAPWGLYLMLHGGKTEEASTFLKTHLDQKLGPLVYFRFEPFLQPVMDAAWMQPYLPIDFELKTTEDKTENTQFEADGADNALEQLMQGDEVFLDPELSLRSLADRMNLTPNRLSWVINEVMGKNFNEYVNGYRLETFKQKALDPANKNFTLLGLAYESGFNSKSVFNQFFKKATGVTPRAWVKARQLDN
jgi:AraC-like DNA-binding protein